MRKVAFLAIVCMACFAVTAAAQQSVNTNLLDSPIKMDEAAYEAGETIKCSLALPGTAAMFGMTTIPGTSPVEFLTSELFSPFRVWRLDENCALISTWTTGVTSGGVTLTGIYDQDGFPSSYWQVEPFGGANTQFYFVGTGIPAFGPRALPSGFAGVWGPACHVSNCTPPVYCFEDIASDVVVCQDQTFNSVTSSFPNPDNTGAGAFGNGLGSATKDPQKCNPDAKLVVTSGTIGEGSVRRASHMSKDGSRICRETWSVGNFSTFVNGIDEFVGAGGTNCLAVVDNVTSIILMLGKPEGIGECAVPKDANMNTLWVDGSQGGANFTVTVNTQGTMSTALQDHPGGGIRKFVLHMNAGAPNGSTLTPTFDLGTACFDFLGGTAVVVSNNVGKTNAVGASNYFGSPTADPSKAPTFIDPLTQVVIDTANLPAGSSFTLQALQSNSSASSSFLFSITNPIVAQIK